LRCWFEEAAGGQRADQGLVDRRAGEVELGQLLGEWQAGGGELIAHRAGLLLGDLGLEQVGEDLLDGVLALEAGGEHLVEGGAHAGELQAAHHVEQVLALHQRLSRSAS
jgi:hypothetical protein